MASMNDGARHSRSPCPGEYGYGIVYGSGSLTGTHAALVADLHAGEAGDLLRGDRRLADASLDALLVRLLVGLLVGVVNISREQSGAGAGRRAQRCIAAD